MFSEVLTRAGEPEL